MNRRNKTIYWIATGWLSLGMLSTGMVQLLRIPQEVEKISLKLDYPEYILTLIGIWKILGVIAVLIPKYPLLKEWAYAGFFFLMTGAVFSHVAVGDEAKEFFGPSLLIILTIVSWYLRPADRKTI
jgi:uncharacterized membrane protein YphA (DoxX/SURF4 family)